VQLDVGSRIPIATTAMGRAYIWALPPEERAALLRELRDHYGSRWPKMRDGIERSGEWWRAMALPFPRASGRTMCMPSRCLKLNDGTGPYAFKLRRAGIPLYGRSAGQRYWTSPCGDGKGTSRRPWAAWRRLQKKKKSKKLNQEGKLHVLLRGSGSHRHGARRRVSYGRLRSTRLVGAAK